MCGKRSSLLATMISTQAVLDMSPRVTTPNVLNIPRWMLSDLGDLSQLAHQTGIGGICLPLLFLLSLQSGEWPP